MRPPSARIRRDREATHRSSPAGRHCVLIAGKQSFLEEARSGLRAGLQSATRITVDDTAARHQATNGFCTQIGNARFA